MAYQLAVNKVDHVHLKSLSNVKLRKQVRNIVYLSEGWKFEISLEGNCYLRWFAQSLETLYLE